MRQEVVVAYFKVIWLSQWLCYGMDDRASIPGSSRDLFPSAQRSDRLWDPPSLLCNGALPPGG